MKPKIYQRLYGTSYETLYVYFRKDKEPRVICDCLYNLFSKDRDIDSKCRHARDLKEALAKNDLHRYKDVSP